MEEEHITCNCCGRILDGRKEDYIYIKKEWNYFSRKDACITELRICEDCYDKLEKTMVLPPMTTEVTELL